jgi:hypothetical protein
VLAGITTRSDREWGRVRRTGAYEAKQDGSIKAFSTRRWHSLRNFVLLRVLLIREFAKEVLRVLYSKLVQLLGFSSADLECSAPLLGGVSGSWKLEGFQTRR